MPEPTSSGFAALAMAWKLKQWAREDFARCAAMLALDRMEERRDGRIGQLLAKEPRDA